MLEQLAELICEKIAECLFGNRYHDKIALIYNFAKKTKELVSFVKDLNFFHLTYFTEDW